MGDVIILKPEVRFLYPDFRKRLFAAIKDFEYQGNLRIAVRHGLRSLEEQLRLYAIGRSVPGYNPTPAKPLGEPVTNAKPGYGRHLYGVAADIVFLKPGDQYLEKSDPSVAFRVWNLWGECAEGHGLDWGGRWKSIVDKPHVQKAYGMTPKEMIDAYRRGGIVSVWEELDRRRRVKIGDEWADLADDLLKLGYGKPKEGSL